jgi:predicted MFS family arabinose efflux permease
MSESNQSETPNQAAIVLQLTILMLSRLVINTSLRMVYPFAPAIARGLNVPLTSVTSLITIRNFSTFISPLFSPLSERYGRRPIMMLGLFIFAISHILLFFAPFYGILGIVLVLISVAKVIYDPAMQSYIGDKVPYAYRGRAISFVELSWAGALFLGGPLIGWLIVRQGWRAPFLWLGILGILMLLVIRLFVTPPDKNIKKRTYLREIVTIWRTYPTVRAAAIYVALITAANEIVFIEYGRWMENSFQATVTILGLTASIIGAAEIVGELLAGWSVDRFGKRQVIMLTGLGSALTYIVMPLFGQTLTVALILLFVMFLAFELTVVGGIPLLTELVPQYRAIVLALTAAFSGLGRAFGSWSGPRIEGAFGYTGNGVVAAAIMITAVIILYVGVHEYQENSSQ